MVHKCCVVGCTTGYASEKSGSIPVFHFPLKKKICRHWVRFVNRANWKPTNHSVICANHFEEKYLKCGVRTTLRWDLWPVPTVMTNAQLKYPSTLLTPVSKRKPPVNRSLELDELEQYDKQDKILCFEDCNKTLSPPLYCFYKHEEGEYVFYYKMSFDVFPEVVTAIKVCSDLKVKLQRCGADVPLPNWFTKGHDARLTRKSMLLNFPSYLDNIDKTLAGPIAVNTIL